ncbi:flagellar filament capping protein FliD [Massilia sp. DWR3-1-1]|uniref:flagellar filament capping protein FliD n=1 Tax=Massilia sp. DWR3-1-1 TaxID=2804559 RepID=UPI003CEE11A8
MATVTSTAAIATASQSLAASSAGSTSSSSSTGSGTTISADVAAKVKQALAPVAAGAQKVTSALAEGQAKLSGLGQLKSALADFQGVAQSLSKPATGTDATASNADLSKKLQSFVSAFNTLNGKLQTLQKGDLKGDPGLTQVSSQLAQMMRDTGGSSGAASLAKAGVTVDASGMMKLDAAKLSSTLAAEPTAVAGLFAANGRGIVDQLGSRLGALNTSNGTVGREAATASRQVSALENRQAALTKTLTAQASALAAFYTQQANAGTSTAPTSLFDMLA